MARIAGVDLPRGKRIEIALTYIYGIGSTRAKQIIDACGIDASRRTQDLDDDDVNVAIAPDIMTQAFGLTHWNSAACITVSGLAAD